MASGIGLLIGVGVTGLWFGAKYLSNRHKQIKANEAINQGDVDSAIDALKKLMLSKLEIGAGSLNKDDPKIFLNDIPKSLEILQKIEELYALKGIAFSTDEIHVYFSEIENLVADKEMWGLTGLKSIGKKNFINIRSKIEHYILNVMP